MLLDKLLSLPIYPLSLSLLFCIAGLLLWAWRRRRAVATLLSCSLGWFALWSLPPVADPVARSLEGRSAHLALDVVSPADVILGFGGVSFPLPRSRDSS